MQSTLECIRAYKKKTIPFLAEKTVCACVHKMALLIGHRVVHYKSKAQVRHRPLTQQESVVYSRLVTLQYSIFGLSVQHDGTETFYRQIKLKSGFGVVLVIITIKHTWNS